MATGAMIAGTIVVTGISLLVSLSIFPFWIRLSRRWGVTGVDENKPDRQAVAEMGGLVVVLGVAAGVFAGFALDFLSAPLLLTVMPSMILLASVGILDDYRPLPRPLKVAFTFTASLPFAFLLPHHNQMDAWWGSAVFVALTVAAGANAVNLLEGFNGLGSGIMAISMMGLMAILFQNNPSWLPLVGPLLGGTCALFLFNRYPARVFPGDTFTLFAGGAFVMVASLSSLGLAAIAILALHVAEAALKFLSGFRARNFASRIIPSTVGPPKLMYEGPLRSLTHIVMCLARPTERTLVRILCSVQASITLLVVMTSTLGGSA